MDSCNRYDVCSVLCVEIVKVRNVLEVVCIDFAAFYYIVRLYVVGVLFNCKGDVFFCKDFLGYCQNFSVWCRGSCNCNFSSLKCSVVNIRVKSVSWVANCAYNCSAVGGIDEVCNLFALKGCYESFNFRFVFVSFFNSQNIAVC